MVVSLRLPPVLQRPLQVALQPLQGSAQVLPSPGRLTLRSLTGLQLQLGLEEGRLQGQDLALTLDALHAGHLRAKVTAVTGLTPWCKRDVWVT